jgi:hypothetical protein
VPSPRPLVSTLIVLVGAAAIAAGVAWIHPPSGLIVAGIALIALGWGA